MLLNIFEELQIRTRKPRFNLGKLRLDPLFDVLYSMLMGGDFYPGFIFIVPPAQQVIGADHGLQIRQQIVESYERREGFANHGRASQAPADNHLKPAQPILLGHAQADVMRPRYGAVIGAAGDCNLEFARQKLKLGMIGRPLSDQLGDGAGVGKLIGCCPGEMIRCDIAHSVATGLDSVHLHVSQSLQYIGHIFEFWPVKLDVLPCGEMAIAFVPTLGNHRKLVHLAAVEGAIGNGDAQHVGMQLQI